MGAPIDETMAVRIFQVRNLDLLTKFGPYDRKDRDLCLVAEELAFYLYSFDSSTTADGITVVEPETGAGRWYRAGGVAGVDGYGFAEEVEDATVLNPVALTPTRGQRWLINGVGAGAWAGEGDSIAEWYGANDPADDDVTDATQWRFIQPTNADSVVSKDTGNLLTYSGGAWASATAALTLHLNGGASKHDASEIDYERADASKKVIAAASDDLALAIDNLDDAIGRRTRTVADVAADRIENDAAEVAFAATHAIAANELTAGAVVRFNACLQVALVNPGDTVAIQARLGGLAGVAVLSIPTTSYATGDYIRLFGRIPVSLAGAGGTVNRDVGTKRSVSGFPFQTADHELDLACPTDVARDFTVTAQWSAAHANNQVDLRELEVEVLAAA